MEPNDLNSRLSRISTRLTMWLQAHPRATTAAEAAVAARQQLVLRYYGAVFRYLLGMLHDPDVAEELTHEFAVRLLRGDFKHFDPERGRFRDFVKVAVRHLVMDHWRKRRIRGPLPLQDDQPEPAAESPPESELDKAFVEKWKEELFGRTWEALEKNQEESGLPYYTVLRCKTDQPGLRSGELAAQVGAQLGKPLSGDALRQLLLRARRRFAELLVDEVGRSLDTTEPERVAEELIELGLMSYCRTAVPGHEDAAT